MKLEKEMDLFHNPEYVDELFDAISMDHPDQVILRWLRATKWNVDQSVEKISKTLVWRNKTQIRDLLMHGEEQVDRREIQLCKCYSFGEDRSGHPVTYVYIHQHIQGEFPIENTINLAILLIETTRKLLRSPHECGTIVLDLHEFTRRNFDFPLVRIFLDFLENHYPESLSLLLIVNAPFLFHTFWTMIKSLIDPNIEKKILFLKHLSDLTHYIDKRFLPKKLHGDAEDFSFLSPTHDEEHWIEHCLQNEDQRNILRQNHRSLALKFLHMTHEWSQSSSYPNESLTQERDSLVEQLQESFQRLLPFIFYPNCFLRFALKNDHLAEFYHQDEHDDDQSKITFF